MKKMHICFYALFQFTIAETYTTAETAAETYTSEFTTVPANEVTESNDCTRGDWGFCECSDDEYRKGFPPFDYLKIVMNSLETLDEDKLTSYSY